jgi:hypothetical protein
MVESAVQRTSVAREWALRFLLIVISVLFALSLAEVAARAFFPISDGRDNVTLDGKPIKDWFEPSSVYRQVSNEYDAVTTITDKGHRVPGTDGNPDVIFVGDSFTYGFGLRDDETFASIYCDRFHLACVNLGMPGSGTLRQVERLEAFITRWNWKPKEVKLFFFGMSGSFSSGNDFVDNFDRYVREHAHQGLSKQDQRETMLQSQQPIGFAERVISWQEWLLQHSTLVRLVKYYWGPMLKSLVVADPGQERMEVALIATRESLAKLDDLSKQVGFTYKIYLLVPIQDIIRGTDGDTLATLNSVSPIPAISTAHLFRDRPQDYYFAFDGHLNVQGSRKVAEFLIQNDQPHAGFSQ